MKSYSTIVIASLLTLTSACSNASQPSPQKAEQTAVTVNSQVNTDVSNPSVLDANMLPADLINGLKLMYEEEKLASDVYATLYDKWGIQAFSNIGNTEIRHQQAVKSLLNNYGITVDERLPVGSFADEHLQQAYDELVAKGLKSEQDALMVSAYVEELDIQDLNRLLALNNPEDIRQTYEWLNMGSRNHLRAFVRNLENRDINYQPQLLDEQEYTAIINQQHERGTKGNGQQGGQNRGQHNGHNGKGSHHGQPHHEQHGHN